MTTLTVETTTIADAVGRAARVAPTKGNAWDKAQGVMLAVRPNTNGALRVTATDLETTYFHRVNPMEAEGIPADWRIPSALLAGFLAALPMDAGKTVTFSDDGKGSLRVACGKASAMLRLINDPLPAVKVFNPQGMIQADDFARKIEQVAWAVHRDPGPLAGVHIDGANLWACDRHRLAKMPCTVPVVNPITVPLLKLAGLLKNSGEVMIRAIEDRLEIMPDLDTQMTCMLYQETYPNVGLLVDQFNFDQSFTLHRERLVDVLTRLRTLSKGERYPQARLSFTESSMGMSMSVENVGTVTDELEISATVAGSTFEMEMWINPDNLLSAAQHALQEVLILSTDGNPEHPLLITDPSQYKTWVMPTREH